MQCFQQKLNQHTLLLISNGKISYFNTNIKKHIMKYA